MNKFILLRTDLNFSNLENIIKNIKLEKTKLKYDNFVFLKYQNIIQKVRPHYVYKQIKYEQFYINVLQDISITQYLLHVTGIKGNDYNKINLGYIIVKENEQNSIIGNMQTTLKQEKYTIKNTPKFNNIITTRMPYFYKKLKLNEKNYCDIEMIYNKYYLKILGILYYCLKENGCYIIGLVNYCHSETFDLIYLLLFLFKKIIIYDGLWIYCENFNPLLSHTDFINLIKKDFTIINKAKLDKLLSHLIETFNQKIKMWSLLLNNKEDDFLQLYYNETIEKLLEINKLNYNYFIDFNKAFFESFKRISQKKKLIKIHSNIKKVEGQFLTAVINHNQLLKCLEVGMAFGISAFYILSSRLKQTKLISIDPNQTSQWNNLGVELLKNNNLHKNHTLIEKKSYEALPSLLEKHKNTFDLIFIDGWHTFDYTLIDFFYSDLLLKKNGYIIIDDALHRGVNKCIQYIDSNYSSFYRKLKSPITLACYKKIGFDDRNWAFHKNF